MSKDRQRSRSKSKRGRQEGQRRAELRPDWIGWAFWVLCVITLLTLVLRRTPGAVIPALGVPLAFALTRTGVTERLQPYHPAYCVGTALTIWALWSLAASGASSMLIDIGLLLLGMGIISAWPGIISTVILTVVYLGYCWLVWRQRLEIPLESRGIVTVEVSLLLLTVAAAWAGTLQTLLESRLAQRSQKRRPPR